MIAANAHRLAPPDDAAPSVRPGHGLRSGRLRWGRCGRKLQGRYWGQRGTAARYVCRGDCRAGGPYCLGFGGASIEKQSSAQVLETISPLPVEASLQAAPSYAAAQRETTHALRLQLQQVEYEAARAFAQYDQAAPKHRLVPSQLASRWQAQGEELAQLQEQAHVLQAAVTPLAEAERQMSMALGRHLRELWCSDDCSMALQKKIIRILIRASLVSLDADTQDLTFRRHWQGGCHPTRSMQKPRSGAIK
jgi:hypothetical protein